MKIVIPAQKPKPAPPSAAVSRFVSPTPPEGILPPRMRPFPRNSFRSALELKALLAEEPPKPALSSAEPDPMPVAPAVPESVTAARGASEDRDSIASTPPPRDVPAAVPPAATTSISSSTDGVPPCVSADAPADPPPGQGSESGDSIQTDKEVADLLLMDVDIFVDQPDEDVDMELEDEEDGLNPPISLGGLAEPMFGVEEEARADLFSLSSRPLVAMSPVFSPALSPAVPPSNEVSREQSVEDVRPATPEAMEPPTREETPPLGRFKVSSLAYLMDKNLSVSPPHSPAATSIRSLTPPPGSSIDMEDEPPTATLFAPMEDVFVLKMQNMKAELKAEFFGHLQEQFGIQVAGDPQGEAESSANGLWANLPEGVVRQIMSERARADAAEASAGMAVDAFGGEFAELADEFKHDSAAQLKEDLEDQLRELVGQFTEELVVPLRDALTLQLKDEIIVQVADQMMDALVVQAEEAQVEFEWRRRFLERQLWAPDGDGDGDEQEEVIQHPLHHLFLSKATSADMDLRIAAQLLC
ncbi:hypothetical protein B0H17DRAFT_646330 [Mycena rosella]|uniref:Uncharacterized protein n=1 Tax=Mycena rosella TaxID=1033263 RepID=A0AAD7DDI2_MYCRO|nr:hypothetical protein B0H17DRAFT_646330 [Mycena rosella]